MKLFILLIIVILLVWVKLIHTQTKPFTLQPDGTYKTTDEVVTSYLHDLNELDILDSILIEKDRQIAFKKAEILKLDSIITIDSINAVRGNAIVARKDSLIHQLMQPVELQTSSSFIKWEGFWVNAIGSFAFTRENLLQPIIKSLEYGISATFGFNILNKLSLGLEPIYFIGSQFRLQAKIGWKIF